MAVVSMTNNPEYEALRADLQHPSQKGMKPLIDRFLREPEYRATVVYMALSEDYPFAWRASWVMKFAFRQNPSTWTPFLERITSALPELKTHQQIGSFIPSLTKCDLSEEQGDRLLNLAIDELEKERETEYTKAHAVDVLHKYVSHYPELAGEFCLIVERAVETAQKPYFRNKALKRVKQWSTKYIDRS